MSFHRCRAVLAALTFLFVGVLPACAEGVGPSREYTPQVGQPGKDVVWVPTPDGIVDKMLEMTRLKAGERLIDLGSGDGKIAIAAAARGARARGVEYNPSLVALSRRNAERAGVRVEFIEGDLFKVNFRDADVVTMYLLPSLNERLAPILLDMKPGTRVASHQFLMGDWQPDQSEVVGGSSAHLWVVPAKVQGRWQVRIDDDAGAAPLQLTLRQRYQALSGQAQWNGRSAELGQARLRGSEIAFTLTDADGAAWRFEGRSQGRNRIAGRVVAAADGRSHGFVAVRGGGVAHQTSRQP